MKALSFRLAPVPLSRRAFLMLCFPKDVESRLADARLAARSLDVDGLGRAARGQLEDVTARPVLWTPEGGYWESAEFVSSRPVHAGEMPVSLPPSAALDVEVRGLVQADRRLCRVLVADARYRATAPDLLHAVGGGARPDLRARSAVVPEVGSVAFVELWPLETGAWLLTEAGAVLAEAKVRLEPALRGRVVLECAAPPARLVVANRASEARDVAVVERPNGAATVRTLAKGETWRSLLAAGRDYELVDLASDEAAPVRRSIAPRPGEVVAIELPLAVEREGGASQASSRTRRP
jgi:hypothetical protein